MFLSKIKRLSVFCQRGENNAKLLQYANTKRINGEFNDVTIQAGGQSIPANRMVLSCYSKFFESMFSLSLKERYQDTVAIQQFDGESIKNLIEFIYTGTIDINTDNVMSLLSTADFLQIDEVKEFCFEFLEQVLTIENCLEIIKVSNLYSYPSTLQQAYQFICEHFLEIVHEDNFKTLSLHDLNNLISKLDRNKVQELSVYKAILSWIQHDDNRKSDFPELFEKINLHKLPSDFVADEVAKETLVKSDLNCSNAVMSYLACKVKISNTKTRFGRDQLEPTARNTNANQSKVIRIGGEGSKFVAEVYNIFGKSSVNYPDLPAMISRHCSVKVDNYIYCIGGKIHGKPTNKVYRMNLNKTSLRWEEVASMMTKRMDFGAAAYDGNIVVAGGWAGQTGLNAVELYNVQTNKWKNISSMKQQRDDHAVVAVGETFYAIGGDGNNSVEQLNGLNGEWKNVQPMNYSREKFAAVYCNGFIYAIGGDDEEDGLTVEKYDLTHNHWMVVSNLNVGRYHHGACVLSNKIYVVGGEKIDDGNAAEAMECYNPSIDQWEIIEGAVDDHTLHSLVAI